jgi:hypothetical protein
MTFSPTPPAPKTATDAPSSTRAVFRTAPTPVITPQPTRQALSSGASGRIFTHAVSGTTVCSAKDPTQCGIASPFTRKRGEPPPIIVPSAVWQCAGRPRPQSTQWPHGYIQQRTTWSPGATDVTPGPTSSTTPAPSWPMIRGGGIGRIPRWMLRSL